LIEVISVKFKNRGKSYYFDPNGFTATDGQKLVVETSKGLELADCFRGNHEVPEESVVQPLRPVVRIATADDARVAEINKHREKEAFEICQTKISEHGLDMKLVDVECNFEGNKITFFFTSDGRVDFRELVKDLAGIFRNRIELRQIGVRDEAKMLGGLGICGRPYCCHAFMEDFQPVSTKMAKVQSLSLNPAKISGSCGRLMCCLRYEEEAYEELVKHVPKQGSFVETIEGYGNAVQVNLLRQTVKVRLDGDADDTLHVFKANEVAQVPGGRPKEGEPLPKVLHYVPEEPEPEEAPENEWESLIAAASTVTAPAKEEAEPQKEEAPARNREQRRRDRRNRGDRDRAGRPEGTEPKVVEVKAVPKNSGKKPDREKQPEKNGGEGKPAGEEARNGSRSGNNRHGKKTVKPVRTEAKPEKPAENAGEQASAEKQGNGGHSRNRRYHYRGKPKNKGNDGPKGE